MPVALGHVDIIERPGSVATPVRPDEGAEGNTRPTSLVGMVQVLLAAEGVTILSVRHLKEAIVSSWRDLRATAVAGRTRRLVLVASVLPAAAPWTAR